VRQGAVRGELDGWPRSSQTGWWCCGQWRISEPLLMGQLSEGTNVGWQCPEIPAVQRVGFSFGLDAQRYASPTQGVLIETAPVCKFICIGRQKSLWTGLQNRVL